jgi:hypothetical protein
MYKREPLSAKDSIAATIACAFIGREVGTDVKYSDQSYVKVRLAEIATMAYDMADILIAERIKRERQSSPGDSESSSS